MNDRVVITACACEYPDASNPERLLENAVIKRRSFRLLPTYRVDWLDPFYKSSTLKINAPYAALLKDYQFDYQHFRIPYQTYKVTDLAHWIALDVSTRALGQMKLDFEKSQFKKSTGVVVANTLTGDTSRANNLLLQWPFIKRMVQPELDSLPAQSKESIINNIEKRFINIFPQPNEESLSGALSNTIAGRIANYHDFRGGAYSIDGACASSLLAVEQANNRLLSHQWDIAVCVGVDISLDPFELIGFSRAGALASQETRLFDNQSNGFWPGEGCGALIMMRESTAIEYKLPILAVIAGCGISSDGHGGMTRPTVAGQKSAINKALTQAQCTIDSLKFIECHGTGTKLGDQVELQALHELTETSNNKIAVGSIKSNIGHTKAAAGMAGLLKAVSCLQHGIIAPTTSCINPVELLKDNSCSLEALNQPKVLSSGITRAGVSAFGFGGVNSHVVLEKNIQSFNRYFLTVPSKPSHRNNEVFIFVFSSDNKETIINDMKECINTNPSFAELYMLSITSLKQCTANTHRLCIIAQSPYELFTRLNICIDYLVSLPSSAHHSELNFSTGCYYGRYQNQNPRIAFIYPGQSAPTDFDHSWLFRVKPDERKTLNKILANVNIMDSKSTHAAQLGIVASEVITSKFLYALGITPSVTLGHSIGEYSAWWAGGIVSEDVLISLISYRGKRMQGLIDGSTTMMTVCASPLDIQPLLVENTIDIACYNSDQDIVLAGKREALKELQQYLNSRGISTTMLNVAGAFHSRYMSKACVPFREDLAGTPFSSAKIPIISSITGQRLTHPTSHIDLLTRQIDNPVQFSSAEKELSTYADITIEVGPGNGLARLINDTQVISTDITQSSYLPLYQVIANCFCLGVDINFKTILTCSDISTVANNPRFLINVCGNPSGSHQLWHKNRHSHCENVSDVTKLEYKDNELVCDNPSETLRAIVALVSGLDPSNIAFNDKLLSDLHLNSISIAEIANKFVQSQHREMSVLPSSLSEGTLTDVVESVLAMPLKAKEVQRQIPVSDWVGIYYQEHTPISLPCASQSQKNFYWRSVTNCDYTPNFDFLSNSNAENIDLINCLYVYINYKGIDSIVFSKLKLILSNSNYERFLIIDESATAEGFFKSLYKEILPDSMLYLSGDVGSVSEQNIVNAFELTEHWCSLYIYNGQCFTNTLFSTYLSSQTKTLPIPNSTTLFTGAAKGIGLECACAILECYPTQTLCIVGSSPEEEKLTQAGLTRLRSLGSDVCYYQCNLSETPAVKELAYTLIEQHPELSIIVHAAGVNKAASLQELDAATLQKCIAVKSDSLATLLEIIAPSCQLSKVMGFGSVIASYGLQGECHYALANEKLWHCLEKFSQLNPMCNTLCIDWSLWRNTGMAKAMGVVEQFEQQGICPISIDKGTSIFTQFLFNNKHSGRYFVSGRWGNHPTFITPTFNPYMLRYHEFAILYYPDTELVLETNISTLTDLYLQDHKISTQAIVPAVFIIEMMVQAAQGLGIYAPYEISMLTIEKPILVNNDSNITLQIHAVKNKRAESTVSLRSTSGDSLTIYANAEISQICQNYPEAISFKKTLSLAYNQNVDVSLLYKYIFFNKGRFKRVKKIFRLHANCICAQIITRKEQWFGSYCVPYLLLGDPGARDACLHMIQACYPYSRLVPTSVESIKVYNTWPKHDYVIATATESKSNNNNVYFNICVCDKDGVTLEHWNNVQFKVIADISLADEVKWSLISPTITRKSRELLNDHSLNLLITQGANKKYRQHLAYQILGVDGTNDPHTLVTSYDYDHGYNFSHDSDFTLMSTANTRIGCCIKVIDTDQDVVPLINSLPAPIKAFYSTIKSSSRWRDYQCAFACWVILKSIIKLDKLDSIVELTTKDSNNNHLSFLAGTLTGLVWFVEAPNANQIALSIVKEGT
jgi:enediyne polyketide synthase